MTLVIDASLTMTWYFQDESTDATDAVLDRVSEQGAIVPALWRLEVANAFQMAIRRRRIDVAFRDAALSALRAMPIVIDPETELFAWSTSLGLAEQFGLTIYDAVYLDLAQRRGLPLATLDQELRSAGRALGVPLEGLA